MFLRRPVILAVAVLIAAQLLSLGTARASGYLVPEQDAEAMGQSVAWAARARGASSIFFNPAGLTQLEGWEVSLGTTLVNWSSKVTGPFPFSFETETENSVVPPSHFYAGYKINEKLAVGIGVNNPWGLVLDWPERWPNGQDFGSFIVEKVDLATFVINPTVAYSINENFSVGAGLQWVIAKAELSNRSNINALAQGLGLPGVDPVLLVLDADNGSGNFGFNAGVQYKSDRFSVGLTYRSSVNMTLEGDADFTTPKTGVIVPLPTGGTLDVDATLGSLFPDQPGGAEIPIPTFIAAGIAVKPVDALEVEFDVNWASWSDFDELVIDFSQETVLPTPAGNVPVLQDAVIEELWEDGFTFRLGGNYQVNDKVQARLGFIYDPTVIPDETLSPLLPEADRFAVSTGLGLNFGSVNLDLAYMFLTLDERTTTSNDRGFNATYETSAHLFSATFSFSGGGAN